MKFFFYILDKIIFKIHYQSQSNARIDLLFIRSSFVL